MVGITVAPFIRKLLVAREPVFVARGVEDLCARSVDLEPYECELQRENVIADFTEPSKALGDGYRVEGQVVIWKSEEPLKIPSRALFRRGDVWSVFVVEDGKAYRRQVQVGKRTPFDVEIINGLEEGAKIIVDLSNEIVEAMAVTIENN